MALNQGKIEQEKTAPNIENEAAMIRPEKGMESEGGLEQESKPEFREKGPLIEEERKAAVIAPLPQTEPQHPGKSALAQEIETIMEQDLRDVYHNMDEKQKRIFQSEGEKTATKIEKLLNEVKVKTNKILHLIKRWLMLIPGVNKFFLEQEAKIKADKIIKLKQGGKI